MLFSSSPWPCSQLASYYFIGYWWSDQGLNQNTDYLTTNTRFNPRAFSVWPLSSCCQAQVSFALATQKSKWDCKTCRMLLIPPLPPKLAFWVCTPTYCSSRCKLGEVKVQRHTTNRKICKAHRDYVKDTSRGSLMKEDNTKPSWNYLKTFEDILLFTSSN